MRQFFISIILLAMAVPVMADPYVGAGVGSAFYKADLTGLGGGELDDNGTGTKLYGGYAFNKYFAAEASVYNFAEASIGAFEVSPGNFASAAVSMKGVGAYAVGMYPVSKKVNLIAKLGVLSWDADLQANSTSGTNDGTDLAYALAASYGFTKELHVTAEWEAFETDNPELSMFSVGFKFIFR
ncbi:MAG: outer membrane beta-barrel protein [Proteobacteria bacterium]|nr:outer membrane beta-barrel protein [Pseudomonadota bacterium]